LIVAGGNTALKPEKARSWTAGFDLKLPAPGDTKFAATYFDTQFRDRIAFPAPNALFIFAQPQLYPGALIRNPTQAQVDATIASVSQLQSTTPPPGSINAIVVNPLGNVASVHANGVDLAVSSKAHTHLGELGATLDVAYLARYDQHATTTSPIIHNLDTLSNPLKNRARLGVSWADRGLAAAGFLNYAAHYEVSDAPGSVAIASWTTADLQLSFNSARAGGVVGVLGDTDLSFSVINVFNRDPPFANGQTGYGYDDANANPYGRMIAIDVRHQW
jgi:outer membrane receptor protein involved in Fe transport